MTKQNGGASADAHAASFTRDLNGRSPSPIKLSPGQKEILLKSIKHDLVFVHGPAGSGKTFGIAHAAIAALASGANGAFSAAACS